MKRTDGVSLWFNNSEDGVLEDKRLLRTIYFKIDRNVIY